MEVFSHPLWHKSTFFFVRQDMSTQITIKLTKTKKSLSLESPTQTTLGLSLSDLSVNNLLLAKTEHAQNLVAEFFMKSFPFLTCLNFRNKIRLFPANLGFLFDLISSLLMTHTSSLWLNPDATFYKTSPNLTFSLCLHC